MKKLRKEIFTRLLRDAGLEEKYLALEIYLKNQMLRNISIFNFLLKIWTKHQIISFINSIFFDLKLLKYYFNLRMRKYWTLWKNTDKSGTFAWSMGFKRCEFQRTHRIYSFSWESLVYNFFYPDRDVPTYSTPGSYFSHKHTFLDFGEKPTGEFPPNLRLRVKPPKVDHKKKKKLLKHKLA